MDQIPRRREVPRGNSKGTAVVTGASSGIGRVYAERLARRGHDLILVARDRPQLEALAIRLAHETGRCIETETADLSDKGDLTRIEALLSSDPKVSLLVNNAGVGAPASLLDSDAGELARMVDVNVTAVMRLTRALLPQFLSRGSGAFINIGSILGIAPEVENAVYGGTKAFVLAFSLALHKEFAQRGIHFQAVLPRQNNMGANDLVDAALIGFDGGEVVTIPSLPDVSDWEGDEVARQHRMPNRSLRGPGARYRSAPADIAGTASKPHGREPEESAHL
ncbi:SDR family NAD(P)-dependent oxidoreductase [Labilithrix luteola]|nr:SDR family NAD(P)-dependent oxidoreductase [Labilithrix luteola]